MEQYIDGLYEVDEDLQRVVNRIAEHDMPQISIPQGFGRMLTLLTKMSGATKVLEIGALGGYSGICLARGLQGDGQILSLELKEEYAEVAMQNLIEAGYGDQVSYRIGDAKESLKELIAEQARFDFFFIDADKSGYPFYLECALELANTGAIIVADNTLQGGRISDESVQSTSVTAMRKFNQTMASDPRLISTILPAFDGLAVAIVK